MENWYVLQCKRNNELRAEQNLKNQGLKIYFPKIRVDKSRSKIPKITIEAMFPGYLFVRLNKKFSSWTDIRFTRGVIGFVRFGEYPTIVPETVIYNLTDAENKNKIIRHFELTKGEKVRISKGNFEDINAIYLYQSGQERSIILINMLGKSTHVNVSNKILQRA